MHQSSESVSALATALAKAQIELVNPEKSMTANLSSERRGEASRTFRYAPLAGGLEIVRKTLGKHELAVMQTTAVDQSSGMVNLTTLLAHSSGEWISSDWPVCQIVDVAVPHRMGAALTYARRYALFALVGIAGEDDLDAPDLNASLETPHGSATQPEVRHVAAAQTNERVIDRSSIQPSHNLSRKPADRQPVLNPTQSAQSREQLLGQVAGLSSIDQATQWARNALLIKNKLTTIDAGLVEQAFQSHMSTFSPEDQNATPLAGVGASPAPIEPPISLTKSQSAAPPERDRIDKSKLFLGAPPRRRDKAHLRYVAAQACLVCGRQPSDPHHLRFAQPVALGRKVSDEFTVPLCRAHHHELHRASNERKWWGRLGLEPMAVAARLWDETRIRTLPQPDVISRIAT